MNKQLQTILTDGLVLFVASTIFVGIADWAFGQLKEGNEKDDPLVAVILQDDEKKLQASLQPEKGTPAADTNIRDRHGRTPLMRAVYLNQKHSESEDPESLKKTQEKQEQLVSARAAMIPMLIENGADPNAIDDDGWSALMWAAWSGTPEFSRELLKAGASHSLVGHRGHTALTLAAMRGNAETAQLLIQAGANPTIRTQAGQTALELARQGALEYAEKNSNYSKIITLLQP